MAGLAEIVSNLLVLLNAFVCPWQLHLPWGCISIWNWGLVAASCHIKFHAQDKTAIISLELLTDNFLIIAIFLAAGMVKGVVGMGLPTLSLALLTLITDLTSAMALMLVPSLVTNVYQACTGGKIIEICKKCALFFVMAGLAIWLGAQALVRVDLPLLSGLLGVCLIIYSVVSVVGTRLIGRWSNLWWVGSVFGVVNGVLTGLTGAFVFPGLMYLQSIGFSRNELLQAMGILFTISTIFLAWNLNQLSLLTSDLSIQSSLAVIPAIAGMVAGSGIRNRISEILFRRLFFSTLSLIGAVLVFNSVVNLS